MCRHPVPVLIALALLGAPLTGEAQTRSAATLNLPILARRVAELEALTIQLTARLQVLEGERLSAVTRATFLAEATTPSQDIAAWRRLKKGMTMAEVRALLGKSRRIASAYTTYWHYSRDVEPFVMFNAKELVDGWKESSH